MGINREKAHAKLSASGSERWLNCAGSVAAEASMLDKASGAAELGTLAHELADICLKNEQCTDEWVNNEISCEYNGKLLKIIVDKDMGKFVQEYLDYVRSHESSDSQLFTEERVDFSNFVPDGFGTLDSAIIDYETGVCHIFDLKYGMTEVDVEGNTQARLYCLGLHNGLGFLEIIKSFRIHIVQPRRFSITSEDICLEELLEFGEYACGRASFALSENAIRTPGEKQCHWCKVRFTCVALKEFTEKIICSEFENLDEGLVDYSAGGDKCLDDPLTRQQTHTYISDQQVKLILDNKKLIEKFLNDIRENTLERLQNGEKIPGYKLVRKRANRKWVSDAEDHLVRKLGEDVAYVDKLISITEASKLLDKEYIDGITYKPEGAVDIAPDKDKRDSVASIIDEFGR